MRSQTVAMVLCDVANTHVLRDTKVERLLQLNHIEVKEGDQELAVNKFGEISEKSVAKVEEYLQRKVSALRL